MLSRNQATLTLRFVFIGPILPIFLHCRVVNKSVFPKRFLHNYTKVMLLHRVIEKFILFSYTFLDFIDYDFQSPKLLIEVFDKYMFLFNAEMLSRLMGAWSLTPGTPRSPSPRPPAHPASGSIYQGTHHRPIYLPKYILGLIYPSTPRAQFMLYWPGTIQAQCVQVYTPLAQSLQVNFRLKFCSINES